MIENSDIRRDGDDAREREARAAADPEVLAKPKRRQFSAAYRLRILEEADGCRSPGEIGRLLRREGLYSSHLRTWRRQRDDGTLAALAPKRRGRKPKHDQPLVKENEQLLRENQRLREKLRQTEIVIDVQKNSAKS
jgi:transposase